MPAQHKLYEVFSRRLDISDNRVKAAGWLYISLSYLFPDENDLMSVSPELKELWEKMSEDEQEKALYFAYSFIDEKRVR